MASETLLEVKGLKKHFPVLAGVFRRQVNTLKAVDGVSLTIQKGETLGVVGESGCGKSTAARAMIRLIEPTEGEIYFRGSDLLTVEKRELRRLRKEIQVVFQDPYASLNPRKTIGESLGEPLLFHGVARNREESSNRVAEVLKRVGLSQNAINSYPHEFSGGQQQRICIGRAIALEPKLIVCDEAVSALDVSVQAQILNLLQDLKEQMGLSYLFISHDLSVVRYFCDRVLVFYLGTVVEEGPASEMFADPLHPYTRALLSAIPCEHPGKRKSHEGLQGEPPSPLAPPPGCPFHPRCPKATEVCKSQAPPQKNLENGRAYTCVLSPEEARL